MAKSMERSGETTEISEQDEVKRARALVADENQNYEKVVSGFREVEAEVQDAKDRKNLANTALSSVLERVDKHARREYADNISKLFGFESLGLGEGESTIIDLDDETVAKYINMKAGEDVRSSVAHRELETLRLGYPPRVNGDDNRPSIDILILRAMPKLVPGTAFYGALETTIKIVAGEASEEDAKTPAKMIAKIRKQSNFYSYGEYGWDVGLSIPVEGDEEPYLALNKTLSFDIDSLIEEQLSKYKEIIDAPDRAKLHDTQRLEAVLTRFGKTSEAEKIRLITNKLLGEAVSGSKEIRHQNGIIEKNPHSFISYKQIISDLKERDSELFTTSLNERALRFAREQVAAGRTDDGFLVVTRDQAMFALAEHAVREPDHVIEDDDNKVDIITDFLKASVKLLAEQRINSN